MILEIYIILFSVSLTLLFIGYYAKVETLKVLSYGLIFILGIILIGYQENLLYTNYNIINSINSTYTIITPNYQIYTNQPIGFIISTLAFLGWLSVYLDFKKRG